MPTEEAGSDFPLLYERYRGLVRGVLFKLCGPSDLDDLVQEAFLRIWKGSPGFDRRSAFRTWVYAIVTHLAADHFRRKGRRPSLAAVDPDSQRGTGGDDGAVNRDLVRRGLLQLSEEHRTALVLHLYEGLSVEEISEATASKAGTVKSRLHYARLAMAQFLESQGVNV
ncbi:MAG: sigma-70 family RNA polymerase sigma factor [Pseudomonadota bacterium]